MQTRLSPEALDAAIAKIDANLTRQVARGKTSEGEKDAAIARITGTTKLPDLGGTDLVIESATERESIKQAIFEDLVPHLEPHTILTSNTSSISITRLASGTDRPEKFMGFHFMNPVPIMQLVELIRAPLGRRKKEKKKLNNPAGKMCRKLHDELTSNLECSPKYY